MKKESFDPVATSRRQVSEVVNVKAEADIEDIKGKWVMEMLSNYETSI